MKRILDLFILVLIINGCQPQPNSVSTDDYISIGTKEFIYSNILEEERELWIHVPPDYYTMNQSNMVYPVIYLMDPTEQFTSTVGILQQLSISNANNFCPPMIVVGVKHEDRASDLTPRSADQDYDTKGGADMLADFLEQEVMPYIDEKYPTTPHRVLIGHSLGGLFVFNTLIHKPHLFDNYVNIDPAMWWEDGEFANEVLDSITYKNFDNKKLYLATANQYTSWITESTIQSDTSQIATITKYNLDFGKSLDDINPKKLTIESKYYENEIHGSVPGPATFDALKFFYEDYLYKPMMDYYNPEYPDAGLKAVSAIEAHYDQLSKQLGYKVLPLESYINAYAFGLSQFGKNNIAKSLLDLNIKNYPESEHVHEAMDHFLAAQQDR